MMLDRRPQNRRLSSVDIFVPCYRYGRFLRQCVESVLSQEGVDVRVLIIDDASPDDTSAVAAELVREDDRVHYVRHAVNKGHIATYNEGLEWASADYMLLLSADDWILPGALGRAARVLDAHPDVGFAYGAYVEVSPGGTVSSPPVGTGWTIMSGPDFVRENWGINPVATCTAVVRTSTQKLLGGYRPELPHSGDMEMWLRFAAHGRVARLNVFQGVYRRHCSNMSINYSDDMMRDLRQREAAFDFVFDAYAGSLADAPALRSYLRRGLAEAAVDAAYQPFLAGDRAKVQEFLAFAVDLDPNVRRSLAWRWQMLKGLIGRKLWCGLRQARSWLRAMLRANQFESPQMKLVMPLADRKFLKKNEAEYN
jgi:glycosyltransferase involved in cell wall biosynthesis